MSVVEPVVGVLPRMGAATANVSDEGYRALTLLERPRGVTTALASLCARSTIRFTDLVRRGLSRWASAESIRSLVRLGVLEPRFARPGKRSEKAYAISHIGETLAEVGAALLDAMRTVEGKDKPDRLTRLPLGSFPTLALAVDRSVVWHSRMVTALGMCNASATRVLNALREAHLLRSARSPGFPPRTLYEATEDGRSLGRILVETRPMCSVLLAGGGMVASGVRVGMTHLGQLSLLDFGDRHDVRIFRGAP